MTTFQELSDATYISVETFRKNGKGVKTPVWFTPEDDKYYCWTIADSGKVKRINNHAEVNLAKCDAQGNIQSEWVSATARVLNHPQDEKKQVQRMVKKYGLMFRLFQFMGKIRRNPYVAIEFSDVA